MRGGVRDCKAGAGGWQCAAGGPRGAAKGSVGVVGSMGVQRKTEGLAQGGVGSAEGIQWHLGARGAQQWGLQRRPRKPALARPSRAPCAPSARAPTLLLPSEPLASMLLGDTQSFFFSCSFFSMRAA